MFSIITCSNDDARFAKAEAHVHQSFAGSEHEIIRIPDARSMCEGYNRGVAKSRGDVLIFTHDDVELLCENLPPLLSNRLQQYDLLGVAGTTLLNRPRWVQAGLPHTVGQVAQLESDGNGYLVMIWAAANRVVGNIVAMDGLWLCAKRAVVEKVGFDEINFTNFHLYDLDFTFRAHQSGFKLAVCTDLNAIHASQGSFGDADWTQAADAFLRKHGPSLSRVPVPKCLFGRARVTTKQQAIDIMTAPWWPGD